MWLKQLLYEKQQEALKDIRSIFWLSLIHEDTKLSTCPDPAMVCISLYNRCQKDFCWILHYYVLTYIFFSEPPFSSLLFPSAFQEFEHLSRPSVQIDVVANTEDWGGGGGHKAERERKSPPPCSSCSPWPRLALHTATYCCSVQRSG